MTALVGAASALVIAALALVLQPWSDGGTGATDPARPTTTTTIGVPSDPAGRALLDRLRGRTFEMDVFRQDGRALTLGRAPRLTFGEPVAIETVCNLASGTASVNDDRLRLTDYVTTAVACGGEGEVVALLLGEPRVLFDGTTLRLVGPSSDAELRELVGGQPAPTTSIGLAPPSTVAPPDTMAAPALTTETLAGTTFTGPGPAAPVTVRFGEGGELTAPYGCNGSGGAYRVAGGVLEVDGLDVTEMGCAPDLTEQDEAVVALLLGPDGNGERFGPA